LAATGEGSGEGQEVAQRIRAELERLQAPRSALRGADIEPMLAETAERAFSRKGWLFELKIDGFRAIASKRGGAVALQYRRGRDAVEVYPDLARALAALPASDLVLDGEIAVLDGKGLPSFQLLQRRALLSQPLDVAKAASSAPATYFAFDLLGFEDRDLRGLPLAERKRLLAILLPRRGAVCAVEHVEERGEELFERVVAAGLEGVMGKQADAPYTPGRSPRWLKVRRLRTADFAIVGFTDPGGTRGGFGALHLALGTEGGLLYAGRVGSGFGERELRDVRERLEPLRVPEPPCGGPVPRGPGNVWVRPRLVCEVRYHQVTEEGLLRQPVFLRMRDDKSAPDPAPPQVQISNPRKLLWSEDGIAKVELIDYYRAIAQRMLPYLRDRALTLTRYPDGISGKFFFQKNAPAHTPGWVRKERIAEAGTWDRDKRRERWGPGSARQSEGPIDAIVCDDEATLVWCANLAAIPLHVPANRIADPAHCDYCVVDLDPKEAPFAHVVEVALAVRELCESIGLPSFVKTSGQKGLHVLLPLGGTCTHDESRALGELVARAVERRLPRIATTERVIEARKGRVYLDYLQNGDGKTIVAAYSVRPVPGATVSTPLRWSEVGPSLDPRAFTLRTVPRRAQELGDDPALAVLSIEPDLPAILGRLANELRR
jgi:bifunctional non-homologous end joining protein LigD